MSSLAEPPPQELPALVERTLVSSFLENVPDYVYFKDRRSRFIAVSKSMIRYFGGATREQIIGRTDFDFFSPRFARPAYEAEQQIIHTGEPVLNKLERELWPDGRVTWVVTSKMPLRDERRQIIGTFGISKDITKTKELEAALEKTQKEIIDASRNAGMAEVATGVLHNVGNVLNSLNVSASVITSCLRQSKADSLAKLGALLRDHRAGLSDYLTHDAKGKRVPEFVASLARHALEERDRLTQEIAALQKNIDHIKEIVSMQQAYATMIGVIEPLDPAALMEDALRMNADTLARHEVKIVRDFKFVPPVLAERSKVLQILINLIRNAKYACDDGPSPEKIITLRIDTDPPNNGAERERVDPAFVCLAVEDNGVGIPAENLTRIFAHGFTTRADGHGFGLHSAANAAHEMKGSVAVSSAGPGRGATFTLQLPVAPPAVPAQ
jgi:PAS domain S-box-containing protein